MRTGAVLVVTHGFDDHVPLVRVELDKVGAQVVLFDTDDFRRGTDLTFGIEKGVPTVLLRVGEHEHLGSSFASVLFRYIRLPTAPQIADPEARRMAASELQAALEGALLALEPAIWINHPYANRAARSKLLQLRLASGLGFTVPDTRVTANPREVRELYRKWDGQMVAKLAGGQLPGQTVNSQYVVFTTVIMPEDLEDDAALSACPTIYQRRVAKDYELRVTVVGDEIFACRINSQAHESARVDWRQAGYDTLDIHSCQIEESVADRCRALLRALNLETGGIDLIVTPEGSTVFLEINAAGQWAFVQKTTGLPIAAAIARRLASAARD
jgi:hypothetical protein